MNQTEIPGFPKRTRETQIRRDRSGKWWNGSDQIEHPNLLRSFDSWIDRAADGRYCLKNDINWAYIEVEGAPYRVLSIVKSADGTLQMPLSGKLSGDEVEHLNVGSIVQDREGVLWCTVREGRVPAVFDNHAATQLIDLMDEDTSGPYLLIDGVRHHPQIVVDPLKLGVTAASEPKEEA